jgi:hypothetical protein
LSDDKKTTTKSAFPVFGVTMGALTLLFSYAKIFGHIDWAWWLVLGPLWMPLAATLAILVAGAALVGIGFVIWLGIEAVMNKILDRRDRKRVTRPKVKLNKRDV